MRVWGHHNRPPSMFWNWVPTIFLWAQGGRKCTCTKHVLYISGYSQHSQWITGPIFLNFGMIHKHVIFFTKYHFFGSGELCVILKTVWMNWHSEYCFRCHSISLRVCFFSSSSHQNEGTNSKESRGGHKISTSNTQPQILKLATWFENSTMNHRIENDCGIQLSFKRNLKLNFMKCIFAVITLWYIVCCIFSLMHFVAITCVEQEQEGVSQVMWK